MNYPWLEVVLNLPVFRSFTYANPVPEEDLTGKRVEVRFGSRILIGFVTASMETLPPGFPLPEKDIKPVLRVVDKEALYGQDHVRLARWMSAFYLCSEGEALSSMLPSGKRESAGMGIDFGEEALSPEAVELSEEQTAAIRGILSSPTPTYLYGVTGSGKTEVFLQAAESVLSQGKGVIYLVPEIALTHQVIDAVTERFGARAAVLHSALTGSRKLTEWMRIRRGEAKIVVGARSAIFAPLTDLGLVIIDEEHDGSYKSGNTPRYHARQVAMRRCADSGARLVMGSATPSLEAWHQIREGSISMYPLTRRLSGGAPPEIRVVSVGASGTALSAELVSEIRAAGEAKRQSIIFLNRRGFSHYFRCSTCGHELLCRNCSVPVTWHRAQGYMKCHYCGWQVQPPSQCPSCGSLDVGYAGFGTEFIEDEVRRSFPGMSVRRVDTDTLKKSDDLKETLEEFRQGKIDILLGTQMVAKGLNFPGVRLVGIALADTGLHMPDFRAAERTFALILQVAGRAGRFFPDGRVIIQTWSPGNPAIAFASRGDVEGFYEWELSQRRELGFPPYSRLIRLVFRSKEAPVAEEGAAGAAAIIGELMPKEAEILGPSECPIAVLAGNSRHQILLRGPSIPPMARAVRVFLSEYRAPPKLHVEVDVDPVSLL